MKNQLTQEKESAITNCNVACDTNINTCPVGTGN